MSRCEVLEDVGTGSFLSHLCAEGRGGDRGVLGRKRSALAPQQGGTIEGVGLVGPSPSTHPSLEMGKVGTGHRRHGSEKVELPQALLRSPAQPGLTFFVHPGPMTSASKPAAD